MSKANNYYIQRGEKNEGPFGLGELRHFYKAGALKAEDLCASDGDPEWRPAKDILPALVIKKHIPGLVILGWVLSINGAVGMVYCIGFFDVSVTSNGMTVANVDLLNLRLCGVVVNSIAWLGGVICLSAHAVLKQMRRGL